MAESLADQILGKIDQVAELYHRLMVVVAPAGAGKTSALQNVHKRLGMPLVNVNLELTRQMLDLTERQRALQLPRLLGAIVNGAKGDIILLDNIEILFNVSLKQDPLRLLQGLSRNKTIVVSWNGLIDTNYLTYATPDHQEYKRYPSRDLLTASPGEKHEYNS
jgi:hypothetical protein